MADKNKLNSNKFPEALLKRWELSDGVNFAIALSQLTGWLLHVDWWCISDDDPVEKMKSLRVYVGVDSDVVFDFQRIIRAQAFAQYIVIPIAQRRVTGKGGISSRYYSEEALRTLPLRVKPDEAEIVIAKEAILKNQDFLSRLPQRLNPGMPAHISAQFCFGWCAVYAEVKRKTDNLPAVGIIVTKYTDAYGNSKLGFCHSVVLHPDGQAEDSWGKQPLSNILENFGIEKYYLSEDAQREVNIGLKKNSPIKYREVYDLAVSYIKT